MLILSRRVGERIVIDGQVWVKVHRVGPNYAEIAITAPKHIEIDREEVFAEKEQERQSQAEPTHVKQPTLTLRRRTHGRVR